MILLDTSILMEILWGNSQIAKNVQEFPDSPCVSSISAMDLLQQAPTSTEIKKLKNYLSLFTFIYPNARIGKLAIDLMYRYSLSHNLKANAAIIAATSIVENISLYTFDPHAFDFIDGLRFYHED